MCPNQQFYIAEGILCLCCKAMKTEISELLSVSQISEAYFKTVD